MHKMGVHTAYSFSQCSDETKYSCSHARAFTALTHKMGVHKSVNALTCLSIPAYCSFTKWAFIRHILSANAQTRLSLARAFTALTHTQNGRTYGIFHHSLTRLSLPPEPSLLSHMHKMGVHTAYSFSQFSDETKYSCSLARAFTALTHAQNGRTYGIFHQSML